MSDASPAAPPPAEEPSRRLRAVYIVLALLAGPLGCHNFYAGRWTRGAVQLALALPGLGATLAWMRQLAPLAGTLQGADPADVASALAEIGVPDSPFLLGTLVSSLWAAVDMVAVKTDGKGRRLR